MSRVTRLKTTNETATSGISHATAEDGVVAVEVRNEAAI
jgi:hypothetical protein